MGDQKPYITLAAYGRDEFVVNKSRFIGIGAPVQSQEQAQEYIHRIRKEFPDANHHCYAYVIGQNAGIQRHSDDGEPGGTAGLPILEVLHAKHIVDAVVVVTRYFGGILLGAGGLVRAYAHGASIAINAARPAQQIFCRLYGLDVPYPLVDKTEYFLSSQDVRREPSEYAVSVTMYVWLPASTAEAFLSALATATDGRVDSVLLDERYEIW